MKVITLKQPFATLVAEGLKEYEFRTWNTKYRGDILIHAGKGIDKEAMKRCEKLNLEYPKGQIIAKATITDSIFVDEKLKKYLEDNSNKVDDMVSLVRFGYSVTPLIYTKNNEKGINFIGEPEKGR